LGPLFRPTTRPAIFGDLTPGDAQGGRHR